MTIAQEDNYDEETKYNKDNHLEVFNIEVQKHPARLNRFEVYRVKNTKKKKTNKNI